MHDDHSFSSDPLRFIDPRYEPLDPLFDFEEPELPPTVSVRRRRALRAALASADPFLPAIE
jgi:hypothetical protein